jgi:TusA-related sulfurtransferase
VVRLARHIIDVDVGQVVVVVADDPAARADIPAWCRMRRHAYLGEHVESDRTPAFLVRRLV